MPVGLVVLLPKCAHGKFDGVRTRMKPPCIDLSIKPDELVRVNAHAHAPMSPLESRDGLVLSSLLYHEDVTEHQNYK